LKYGAPATWIQECRVRLASELMKDDSLLETVMNVARTTTLNRDYQMLADNGQKRIGFTICFADILSLHAGC